MFCFRGVDCWITLFFVAISPPNGAPAHETQEQGSHRSGEQQTAHFDAANRQDPNPPESTGG